MRYFAFFEQPGIDQVLNNYKNAASARSRQAADMLRHIGYLNVNNIGGIAAYFGKVER